MKERTLSDSQLQSITDLVCARTGLAFGRSRWQQAEAGIGQTMAATGTTDPDRFSQILHTNERIFQALIENLTVSETYFFRERVQFEVLREKILPELQRHFHKDQRFRFWSAGCASGEEPFSLAILLEQEGLVDRTSIIATDISDKALTLARKASYGVWSFRDNPLELANQYFQRRGDRLVLIERIRRLVEFDTFNLASEIYPSRITGPTGLDVIMCRNVLIYFDPDTVERVAKQMFASLKEGGWLITGPSDPPLWHHASYETVLTTAGVLYRRARRSASRKEPASATLPAQARHRTKGASRGAAPSLTSTPATLASLRAPTPARRGVEAAGDDDASRSEQALKACMLELQTLANLGDAQRTAAAAKAAVEAHPLSPEVHYLQAIVLMSLGRYEEAASSLRRVIYLDRSMAVAHFTLGSVLQRRGSVSEARRSYRNVLAVCGDRRGDELVPFSEGEPIGRLIDAARAQLALIQESTGSVS